MGKNDQIIMTPLTTFSTFYEANLSTVHGPLFWANLLINWYMYHTFRYVYEQYSGINVKKERLCNFKGLSTSKFLWTKAKK